MEYLGGLIWILILFFLVWRTIKESQKKEEENLFQQQTAPLEPSAATTQQTFKKKKITLSSAPAGAVSKEKEALIREVTKKQTPVSEPWGMTSEKLTEGMIFSFLLAPPKAYSFLRYPYPLKRD